MLCNAKDALSRVSEFYEPCTLRVRLRVFPLFSFTGECRSSSLRILGCSRGRSANFEGGSGGRSGDSRPYEQG